MQRSTSAANKIVSEPEVRWILIKSSAFENPNSEYRTMIRFLKARSAPIDEWIRNTTDVGSYNSDVNLIEMISKNFKKNQNV